MERSSLFSGWRKRNMPDSNCTQSEPNALADMQSTRLRERSSPSSIFAALTPAPLSHPMGEGNHWLEHPFIEPHLHPVRPQPLGQRTHHRLVLRAVAEEDVVGEVVGHGHFLFTR